MTRLFDFIHHHGCRIADKRTRKHEAGYAEREDVRRVVPGVILGTEGPGGLDGFFDDLNLSDKYRPWWHTATLHVHWWLRDHGPSEQHRKARCFWQRGKQGFSYRDVWNLDTYLARVIRDSIGHLQDASHGHPDNLTAEEWDEVLTEIRDGMQAHLDIEQDPEKFDKRAVLVAKRDHAFFLLRNHFDSLWD